MRILHLEDRASSFRRLSRMNLAILKAQESSSMFVGLCSGNEAAWTVSGKNQQIK